MDKVLEDYVSFETAKLLKEKGFQEDTRFVWYEKLPYDLAIYPGTFNKPGIDLYFGTKETEHESPFNNKDKAKYIDGDVYCCPSLGMVMKWLRDVHNWYVDIRFNRYYQYYIPIVYNMSGNTEVLIEFEERPKHYEKAGEICVNYILEKLI